MSIALEITPEIIEAIATSAAEIMIATVTVAGSPWMTRKEATACLRLPVSRLEKDRRIPCHRDGGRVLYHRNELDSPLPEPGPMNLAPRASQVLRCRFRTNQSPRAADTAGGAAQEV